MSAQSISRTPSRGSVPETPYSFGSDDGTGAKLHHLAMQFATHTMSSRAQFQALDDEVSQMYKWQEEVVLLARAEEARRQNRVRALAGQELLPVTLRDQPPKLPAISSIAALEEMSDSDLTSWYAYYSSTPPPTIERDTLVAALTAEVGLSPSHPPSYAQATSTPTQIAAKPEPSLSPSPTFLKWAAVLGVLAAILVLSVINRDNTALQSILQQIVQIIGQYLLKSSIFMQNASVKMLAGAEAWGSALRATRVGTPRRALTTSSLPTANRHQHTTTPRTNMSESVKELADIPKNFIKEGMHFMNRCTKPSKTEYIQLCRAVGVGFLVMGFIGYIVKLIHIPINNILVGGA
ncbi:hypothetical protein CspeluHIS016_0500420 [Cutaneotrichosporon spelunceum]|uniref:Uncharacterized protein n=1 Tax=Cutaneotrichosporon spelunceum TaxID=1672016 RepID=A0AAD3YCD9_9TREE|nr:hypothetical protein CspeluHIS016_0500420 [Cutaneotrichosporon spelunceum]